VQHSGGLVSSAPSKGGSVYEARGLFGDLPPLGGVCPTTRMRATSYKSGKLSAIGFRHLSVEQRRTLPATEKEGRL
jgi:hypothetical protein